MISLAPRLLLQVSAVSGCPPECCSSTGEGNSSEALWSHRFPGQAPCSSTPDLFSQDLMKKTAFLFSDLWIRFFPPYGVYCRSMIFKCWHKHKYYSWTVGNRDCLLQQRSSVTYNYVYTYMAPFSEGAELQSLSSLCDVSLMLFTKPKEPKEIEHNSIRTAPSAPPSESETPSSLVFCIHAREKPYLMLQLLFSCNLWLIGAPRFSKLQLFKMMLITLNRTSGHIHGSIKVQ